MNDMGKLLITLIFFGLLTSCAKNERTSITIDTNPQGAKITLLENVDLSDSKIEKELGVSPVDFPVFTKDGQKLKTDSNHLVTFTAAKDGYFNETSSIPDLDQVIETGTFTIQLQESPLWSATESSNATNQWMQLIVNGDISAADMWQRVVAAVTRRFQELKEYDFNSGYLVSAAKIKKFNTARGVFLLRTKFIATVMERNPLTYRLKIESHWSDIEGTNWHQYPRVFKEDVALVKELMERFQAY